VWRRLGDGDISLLVFDILLLLLFDVLEDEDRDDEKETDEDERDEDENDDDRERERDSDNDCRLGTLPPPFDRLLLIEEEIIDVDSNEVLFISSGESSSSLLT
jgi:hypothetical protein